MNHVCSIHNQSIILICIDPKCTQNRPSCLICLDQFHHKHQIVSINYFLNILNEKLQRNKNNPEKVIIIKELNKAKDQLLQKLQILKNKMIGLIGECEDKILKYFSSIFHSFAVDSHEAILKNLSKSCTSAKITQLLQSVKSIQNITLGSLGETQKMLSASMCLFKQEISQVSTICVTNIDKIKKAFDNFQIGRPKQVPYIFSGEKIKKQFLSLNDSLKTIKRHNGFGGYPMCLTERAFDPINNKIKFFVKKIEHIKKKSICLGVCLYNIVKTNNFVNCAGFNKGIYAIDQSYSYSLGDQQTSIASWNHHDQSYNQNTVGNTNLIGWVFSQGDKIHIEVDYYNSMVLFVKSTAINWEEDDQAQVYQMPIKLNGGPIYGFVSVQSKGDQIQLIS